VCIGELLELADGAVRGEQGGIGSRVTWLDGARTTRPDQRQRKRYASQSHIASRPWAGPRTGRMDAMPDRNHWRPSDVGIFFRHAADR
jgi:hypothetical protein